MKQTNVSGMVGTACSDSHIYVHQTGRRYRASMVNHESLCVGERYLICGASDVTQDVPLTVVPYSDRVPNRILLEWED